MKLKTGKDEIVYLLTQVAAKYESDTGHGIKRNTNRKNYEDLGRHLSDISNRLPYTYETLDHDYYPADTNINHAEYPLRKYDITGGQLKDAITGIVSKPRPFLVDACYIYLYGFGRKGFAKKPVDQNLLDEIDAVVPAQVQQVIVASNFNRERKYWMAGLATAVTALGTVLFLLFWQNSKNTTVMRDMSILPYKPTQAEIDSLQGIWLCYTGSPQARSYDPKRYHKIVSNIADVQYKNGYFTFVRYGSNFDHLGYMQYEAPWLVSVHSHVKNEKDSIESPKLSLMRLDGGQPLVSVISASWNFDTRDKNRIIGIREVYIKQGKGGSIEEIINTPENASCGCKIVRWHQPDGTTNTYYLKNELLDTLQNAGLKQLLDEKSILLRHPSDAPVLLADSAGNKN